MMAGFDSPNGELSPGHTSGPMTMSPRLVIVPVAIPATAPDVLKRFQPSASMSTGKFVLAASA
jgi:hypothetical protein